MELKEKTPHTILNEIIEAAKECGQVMLQADRENFGIKDKAGKANFVTKYDCKIQEMLEKGYTDEMILSFKNVTKQLLKQAKETPC